MQFILLFSFLIIATGTAQALDIYSFVDKNCSTKTGLIVGVEDSQIQLLSLDGEFKSLPLDSTSTIVIFSTLQNPFPQIKISDKMAELAKEVYINGDDNPLFVGWPIRFIEDLVIFYDTSGKTHVLELSDITKIKGNKFPSSRLFKNESMGLPKLNFTDINTSCANLSESRKDGIGPTRIISDKISISEFISNFEKGFRKINNYQERTHFYSKPFLFEKRSKLGVIVFNSNRENVPLLPIYFQWSTGKAYGFQTFNTFGAAPVEWVPLVEPAFAIRSDIKSHFFNASFVGNIPALPAGSSYVYNTNATFPKDVFAANQFNYLALMGADYGPYSLSFGTYFPIFAFQVKNDQSKEMREVLANSVSPAIRAVYSKGPLTLRAIYSATQADGSGYDDRALRVWTGQINRPDSFRLTGAFFRAGVDYKISEELKVGVDEVYSYGNYSESFNSGKYFFNATHFVTSAYVLQSFGYYISFKALLNYFNNGYDYQFINGTSKTSTGEMSVGGAFEFVF